MSDPHTYDQDTPEQGTELQLLLSADRISYSFNCTFLNWMNMQTFIYSNQPDAVLSPAVADIFLATWGQQKQALNTTLTYF